MGGNSISPSAFAAQMRRYGGRCLRSARCVRCTLNPYVGHGSSRTTFFGRFLTGFWVVTYSRVEGAVNAFCCGGSLWVQA